MDNGDGDDDDDVDSSGSGGGGDDAVVDDGHCGQPHGCCTTDIAVAVPAAGSGRTGNGFHMTCCGCRWAGTTRSGFTIRAMGRLTIAAADAVAVEMGGS